MKHRQFLLFVCMIAAFALNLQAQESENSLEDQFTDVIENSNRYQDYKVVKIFKLNTLKKSVTDSLNALQNDLSSSNAKINELTQRIDSLQQEINKTETALGISKEKEDGIHLFGALIKKSTYNAILWSIIGVLLLVTLYFIYRFKSSNSITKEAQEKLTDTEAEFESHRQRSLEREQQLRRKLQDELNKQKKS